MSIRIDKGVPISEHYLALYKKLKRPSTRHSAYPFGDMAVGDSFKLPLKNTKTMDHISSFRAYANIHAMRFGIRLLIIRDDNHEYRCYRVE